MPAFDFRPAVLLACALWCSASSAQEVLVVPQNGQVAHLDETVTKAHGPVDIRDILTQWSDLAWALNIARLTEPYLGSHVLPQWSEVIVSWGPSTAGPKPYILMVRTPRSGDGLLVERVTVALNDKGEFVVMSPPSPDTITAATDGRSNRYARD